MYFITTETFKLIKRNVSLIIAIYKTNNNTVINLSYYQLNENSNLN